MDSRAAFDKLSSLSTAESDSIFFQSSRTGQGMPSC